MGLRHYLIEMFEPTILFGLFAALLGVLAANHYGRINVSYAALAVIAAVLANMCVNLVDDYIDYTSGLDKETTKTRFSGGSTIVVEKLVKAEYILYIALMIFLIDSAIGFYLISKNILLLPIYIIGAISILLYARYLAKIPFVAEPFTALNFTLICIGSFIAAGGSVEALLFFLFAAIPAGTQIGIALAVNELPDRVPDTKFGRRNTVIMLKSTRNVSYYYVILNLIAYLFVVCGVVIGVIPAGALVVLLTIPVVWSIQCGIRNYKKPKSYERVMGIATMTELATILMLAIAFI